jgi:hypothetical protein
VSEPTVGRATILTAARLLAPPSRGSVNPNCAVVNTCAVSSSVVTVLLVPIGASLTAVTLNVKLRATGSRSTPPFDVPPSSRTWNVKLP